MVKNTSGAVAQLLLKELSWADGAVTKFQPYAGMLFRSDAAEKLVQIMNDSHAKLLRIGMRLEARGMSSDSYSRLMPTASTPSQYTNDLIRDAPC